MEDESLFINDFSVYTARMPAICRGGSPSPPALNLFLYNKYSSSQNYYYTKDVNNILSGAKTPAVLAFTDIACYCEDEQLLKRQYAHDEYPQKIALLSEYYKYHEDVPRVFSMPVAKIVHNYYDKKRRINYIRITRMLREENPDMTASDNLSNVHVHDSDTNLSVEDNETLPRSLYKLLPDEMTPRESVCLNETSGRKDRMASSLTVYDLTDVLSDIFKKSGKLLEKRKMKGKVLQYSKVDSDPSLSFNLADLQQWSTKHLASHDGEKKSNGGKKLFLSSKAENYMGFKPSSKQLHVETTKNAKAAHQIKFSEIQPCAFKKKKEAHESKNIKFSSIKNEDFLKKLAAKNIDVKNLVKKSTNLRFILNTDKLKEFKEERKDKIGNLNINNLNININFNGSSKSNRLIGSKKTGSLGFSSKNDKPRISLIAESPSYSLLKNHKNESNRDRETRGRSINFTNLRNWNGTSECNLNTRTLDKNMRLGDLSTKMKDVDGGVLNLHNLRKSFKHKANFATFYLNKQQTSTMQPLKGADFFKSKEAAREGEGKNPALYRARLAKASSPTMNDQHRAIRDLSKDIKLSQRRHKSRNHMLNYNNQIKIFMSQDYKENRQKATAGSKSIKNMRSMKIGTVARNSGEKQKQTLKDLLEDGGIYGSKFSTFGASLKGKADEHAGTLQYNTMSHANTFNRKKSHSNNTIKMNIENSIKGGLSRKNTEEGLADELEGARAEHQEEASADQE